uniref:fibronectin type III domain-containing protein n=1 Tax=Candidatus Electronema sp. TaxID=2698783 RepID=UPI00405759EB
MFSNRKPFIAGNEIKTFHATQIFLPLTSIPITDISGVTTPVEFRLYIYGHTDEWESVGLGERQAGVNGFDLEVIGTVGRGDIQAPSVPGGLNAANLIQTSFTLNWTPSNDNVGVTGYEVFRDGTRIGTPTGNSLNVAGLAASTTYSMTVRARDAAGNFSQPSAALRVTTPPGADTQAPTVPTALRSSNISPTGFTVSWTVSTDNVGVVSYEVLVNGASRDTVNHPATSLNITGLAPSTNYSVAVRARDAAGNVSGSSGPINVTTPPLPGDVTPPSAPSNLSFNTSTLTLNWTASTDNVGVVEYRVFVGSNQPTSVNTTSHSLSSLAAGTYSITVRALDAAGNISAASAALSVTIPPPRPTSRTKGIGMNTHLNIDYNIDKPFADAMRVHRSWDRIGSGAGADDAPRDASGWPTTDAICLVYHGLRTAGNHGTYRLTFNGQATLSSGDVAFANQSYNSANNTTTADLIISSRNNEQLFITFSSTRRTAASATNTGVTNVRLMRPSAPGSATPYPPTTQITNEYLSRLAPFSCIRYMGWTHTNDGSTETTWGRRIRWSRASIASGNGRANWESVIVMANAANKDAWICIPHQVDDTYIRNLALMFRYGSDGNEPYTSAQSNPVVPPLNPGLKLYVEYSNEIWNWGGPYTQTPWVRDRASTFGAPLNFDGDNDEVTLLYRFKAMRTVQISIIFRSVFGGEMMSRVRPVLCWQQNYGDITNRTLSFIDRYYNRRDSRSGWSDPHPVNYYIYGGGGSAYWYTDGRTTVSSSTLWNNGGWNPAVYQDILYNDMAFAKTYGLAYVLYEADAHPTYENNDATIMRQTHLDPRMNAETVEHINACSALEGDLFCFLVLASWQDSNENYWGVINMDNPANSPQYDAVRAVANRPAEPCSRGAVVPFTRPGAAFDCPRPAVGSTGSHTLVANAMEWDRFYASSYIFRTTTTGTFNVQVEYSTTAPATLVVEFAGNAVGTFNLPSTGGAAASTPQISISCTADRMYAIRTIAATGSVTVRSVRVS